MDNSGDGERAPSSPNNAPIRIAKELAMQFGQLLDDRALPLGPLQELNAIAILAGADSWDSFKSEPERYSGGADCRQVRAEEVLRYLNSQPTVRPFGPATLLEVLNRLVLPGNWTK
ncbi:hypothetical protein ACQ858_14930 [Variovorax ureilyticus]|uniref:hypothetical protein n=1 Tax=Variovorax ureilyticus TaxID=1836198 RepID=UPI003D66F69C